MTKDVESCWILIARWLKDEGIRAPEQFLPPQVLSHALKRVRSAITKLSPRDIHYWRLMSIWKIYFDRLFDDRSRVPETNRGVEEELIKLGYPRNVVECSTAKRSAVQAVADWLEGRGPLYGEKHPSSRRLENAYSKVSVAIKKARSSA